MPAKRRAGAPSARDAAKLATVGDAFRLAEERFRRAGLAYGHGTDNPRDEAAFVVLEGLRLPIDDLAGQRARPLKDDERDRLLALIEARIATRKPAAYLLNRAYMHRLGFYVDERVIVPRSYIGEILNDPALVGIGGALVPAPERVARVLDLCTGSGCLAILAAIAFPNATVDATDLSADALDVARINVENYGLGSRIELLRGDLYAPVAGRRYDLIVANPPYVAADAMAALPPEYRHEPRLALAGGDAGIDLIVPVLAGAAAHLAPAGGLLCEVGRDRAVVEQRFPRLDALWLDTATSEGEVLWADRAALARL